MQGGAFASLKSGSVTSGFDDPNIYGGLLGNEAGEMNGGFGFGRSGLGPGGGGTGVGTIGTGRYGTIGHGTGTGIGYGAGRGNRTARPSIAFGPPGVTPAHSIPSSPGELDRAIVRRYLKRHQMKLLYCYEKQLVANTTLTGTVTLTFVIDDGGLVPTSAATGVDPEVASCIASAVKAIEFPKPKGEGGVKVVQSFTFRPAGG